MLTIASELGKGKEWLYGLRSKGISRERAQQELTYLMAQPPSQRDEQTSAVMTNYFFPTMKGVGKKVADCVCLFSLDKLDAIPVDTHVRQIGEGYPWVVGSVTLTYFLFSGPTQHSASCLGW